MKFPCWASRDPAPTAEQGRLWNLLLPPGTKPEPHLTAKHKKPIRKQHRSSAAPLFWDAWVRSDFLKFSSTTFHHKTHPGDNKTDCRWIPKKTSLWSHLYSHVPTWGSSSEEREQVDPQDDLCPPHRCSVFVLFVWIPTQLNYLLSSVLRLFSGHQQPWGCGSVGSQS